MRQTRLTLDCASLLLSLYQLLGGSLSDHTSKEILQSLQFIETHLSDVPLDTDMLAAAANVSVAIIYERFTASIRHPQEPR